MVVPRALRACSSCSCRGPSTFASKRLNHFGPTATSRPHRLTDPSPFIRPLGDRPPDQAALKELQDDFHLYPSMFTSEETVELLKAALWKLDRVDPVRKRRRRKVDGQSSEVTSTGEAQDLFAGDYGFEEGHFDSVIHHYRETTISSLPPASSSLISLLNRAYFLLPGSPQITSDTLPPSTITHLLHLAPHGEILGHVDNLDASGKVIMGICLGAERLLRLEQVDQGGKDAKVGKTLRSGVGWEVLLPNGAVYIQKDRVRYQYDHSILPYGERSIWNGRKLDPGHRISIMVRDAPSRPPESA